VFGELHGDWNAWSALAGARYEDNEQFGSHVTGNVGLGRALNDRLRLTATWGTAFHAPTFNELYYPGFSNPNLKPEESRSLELGLRGRSISIPLDWSLQLFQTDIDQLIGLDAGFAVVNIDKSRIRGAELQGNWHNERWRVGGQLTRLDPVNRTDGNLLRRRAKESASLELRRIWPSFTVGAVARYQGRRFEDVANTQPLGGYVTTDLMATQSIGKAFELQARVANVLDRSYETAAFYLQDGRNYNVALRYRFAGER
jgi:vitamin B12 transporter